MKLAADTSSAATTLDTGSVAVVSAPPVDAAVLPAEEWPPLSISVRDRFGFPCVAFLLPDIDRRLGIRTPEYKRLLSEMGVPS
jgi:hypothetical protein